MALAALHDWGEVGERPGDEGMKVGKQTLAYWGEGVFDARGDFGVQLSRDKAVRFEALQSCRQYFGRDVGQGTSDFIETGSAVFGKDAQNQYRPFSGKARQDVTYRAGVDVGKFF